MKETDPYFRLRYSWDMIHCLDDFINCIGLHKTDLKSQRNIGFMKFNELLGKKNFNPGGVLTDYIYLEACSFFQYARKLKDESKNIPELPIYFKKLKDFRNKVVAHRDCREDYKSYEEWTKAHEGIQKLIPVPELIKDIQEFYTKVMKMSISK